MRQADEHVAQDLALTIENEYDLYNQKESIQKNLSRKYKNGRYSHALAPKLWLYLVTNGAKMYYQNCGVKPDVPTRKLCAQIMADEYLEELKLGNFTE